MGLKIPSIPSFSGRNHISTFPPNDYGRDLEISDRESSYDIIGLGTSTPASPDFLFYATAFRALKLPIFQILRVERITIHIF